AAEAEERAAQEAPAHVPEKKPRAPRQVVVEEPADGPAASEVPALPMAAAPAAPPTPAAPASAPPAAAAAPPPVAPAHRPLSPQGPIDRRPTGPTGPRARAPQGPRPNYAGQAPAANFRPGG